VLRRSREEVGGVGDGGVCGGVMQDGLGAVGCRGFLFCLLFFLAFPLSMCWAAEVALGHFWKLQAGFNGSIVFFLAVTCDAWKLQTGVNRWGTWRMVE
jgi:hypothetical protein